MKLGQYQRELSVALTLVVLGLVLAVTAPQFYTPRNLLGEARDQAPILIMAVGMTLLIICGQIDISVGSQFAVCGVVAGLLAQQGVPIPLCCFGAVGTGLIYGAINGLFVAVLQLPAVVMTLGTMVIGREALRYLRQGAFVGDLPASFQWFGLGQTGGIAVILAVAGSVFLTVAWSLRYLTVGRWIYATGSDPEMARLVGIRPRLVIFTAYAITGGLTGLAAMLSAIRFVDVDPNAGTGLELQIIAAVILGSTAITGGRGTLLGTLLGVMLLGLVGPSLVFLGAGPQWEKAIQGAILLLAVAGDALSREGR